MTTITIAAPIRDREWILPYYLKHIENIDYPKDKIELLFVVNDSTDNSFDILHDYQTNHKNLYKRIRIETYNRKVPIDNRVSITRKNHIYDHLSKLKNYIMSQVKTDYLLFVDSDILVSPDIINNLLKHQKDIVSGLIWNGYLMTPEKPYLYPNVMKLKDQNSYIHIVNHRIKNTESTSYLTKVDLTGAVILLSKKVYKSIKYGFHPQGEDAYFCKIAQDKGFEIFCDLGIFCHHIMDEKLLREFINEEKNNCLCKHD
ncbi:glycosyltransferase [Paenibacillus lautus]|uniref:glycosyltransferase n=1 Tax=Paenibacillus lautus TaxID=1401 RepID=UPI001C7DB14B|nr:glycosyltransferase [Paenibacillus lautus]MBX4152262.1 glycosyltransferase [Paenibacillus lautus]